MPSIVSIITVYITQHMMIKRDNAKYENESKEKNNEIARQKEIQRAQNLYKIIKPALYNTQVQAWIKNPNTYNQYYFEDLKNELDTDSFYNNKDLDEWWKLTKNLKHQIKNKYIFEYIDTTIKNDIESDIQDFKARYVIIENDMVVKVDIEKLNTDINTINNTLGLYIETYQEDNNLKI